LIVDLGGLWTGGAPVELERSRMIRGVESSREEDEPELLGWYSLKLRLSDGFNEDSLLSERDVMALSSIFRSSLVPDDRKEDEGEDASPSLFRDG
jgi:hypothetical protein